MRVSGSLTSNALFVFNGIPFHILYFFFNDPATTEIYTLSLHDALPISLEPRKGIERMKKRRGLNDVTHLCSGPGKLTQALGITNRHHELDLCSDPRHCFARNTKTSDVVADKRIGITRSAHYPWRFTLRGSPFVSRAVRLEGGAPPTPLRGRSRRSSRLH